MKLGQTREEATRKGVGNGAGLLVNAFLYPKKKGGNPEPLCLRKETSRKRKKKKFGGEKKKKKRSSTATKKPRRYHKGRTASHLENNIPGGEKKNASLPTTGGGGEEKNPRALRAWEEKKGSSPCWGRTYLKGEYTMWEMIGNPVGGGNVGRRGEKPPIAKGRT